MQNNMQYDIIHRYRDQYWLQYQVSRYRHVQNTDIGFNTWTSGRLSRGYTCLASNLNLFFWSNSEVAVIQATLYIGIV
jgi:hypothetical protein